ncbi:class F sortase [Leucobacter luti]|uniref:class F sortase n=1 Tax=Leucobacter luti TaxID=340320 RepID=UPI00102B3D72|nr:class F sortase [Leucobacter luti]MBL3698289.1 class F sortase [Leucobacter luti]
MGATALTVVGGLALVGFGAWQLLAPPAPPTGAERRAVPRISDELPPAAAAAPSGVAVPAIGFVADVLPLAVGSAAVLDPPTADEAYWLSDYGMPGSGTDNTVFLIGHTSADARAVFDPLVDRARQDTTLMPGDEILLATETGTVAYEVIGSERHEKTRLAELENVWESDPGRLVLITCLFQADRDLAPDNVVVFARQAE